MNVAGLLESAARNRPGRGAWVFGSRNASYAALRDRVSEVAGALSDRGLVPGDRVVIDLPNGPELIEALFACFWGGFVAVPVNWHLHPDEIAYIVGNCRARAVFLKDDHALQAALSLFDDLLTVNVGSGAVLTGACGGSVVEVEADDPAWLFYTSGTTGRPKGAVLSHRNLLAMTLNYFSDVDSVEGEVVFLHAAPLTHGSGLYLLPAIARAATNVILDTPRFTPSAYLSAVEYHRVTHGTFLAPTMLKRVIDDGNQTGADLSTLRSIVVGGAPLYSGDLEDARSMFGPIITQIYGQGEAPMTITTMRADDPGAETRSGSAGRPFTGVSVEVRDSGGHPVATGAVGEVCVRGDVVMGGYWDNPAGTAAALVDGWLHTGDVGFLDDAGYLFLTDRQKDVIITGGSNVYPREVEEALVRHPAVAEVSVIGVPDREWGESICAVVVPAEGAAISDDELLAHCRGYLASFKKPRRFVVLDSLPKNAAGKILKRELRDVVAATLAEGDGNV